MQVERETFVINSKEYQASKIPAFKANSILMKLQKLIVPAVSKMHENGAGLDLNVIAAFQYISADLDDSVMTDIILPTFDLAVVYSMEEKCKINSEQTINKVFKDADGLADFYQLIFEVLKYNFAGFFTSLAARFGQPSTELKATE